MTRRMVLGAAGLGGAALLFGPSVLLAAPAFAETLPVYDSACPDPTGWATARFSPHAGYPQVGSSDVPTVYANCTNYIAWVMMFKGVPEPTLTNLGDGSQWATQAAGRFAVDDKPKVGSVAQWVGLNHVEIGRAHV